MSANVQAVLDRHTAQVFALNKALADELRAAAIQDVIATLQPTAPAIQSAVAPVSPVPVSAKVSV